MSDLFTTEPTTKSFYLQLYKTNIMAVYIYG